MGKVLIFDVDGVVVDSPHEAAWGEALAEILANDGVAYDPATYTSALYQAHVAGKPRYDGAASLLAAVGVEDPGHVLARRLGDQKQIKIRHRIEQGRFAAFRDALNLVQRARTAGWRLAVASSSQNANAFLSSIATETGRLIDCFDANVCGRSFARGKPAPDIFLAAAEELGAEPGECVVVEDAPAGIEAATAAGMRSVGIARSNDAPLLRAAGATWVVESLDDVDLNLLAERV
ncbi:MAG: HAD-IA family hydrolase [Fimbriimonadaceae bacterium]